MELKRYFSARARKRGIWLAIAFFALIVFILLSEPVIFLATRPLIRDTLLSWGLGERIEDARVSAESCTTAGRWVYPRRAAAYIVYDTDCTITISVPAKAPYRRVERSRTRVWAPEDSKQALGAGELLGRLGTRWPGDVLWGMWRKVPGIFFLTFGGAAAIIIFAVWRWRRWWWHDRFRRRKRF